MNTILMGMAANYQILAAGGFYYVDHVGHSNYPFVLVKNRFVVNLKELALSNGFVGWVPLQHKRDLIPDIEGNYVIALHQRWVTSYSVHTEWNTF